MINLTEQNDVEGDESGTALVIAGHGSLLNPNSDEAVIKHADAIRRTGIFDEVQESYWKQEPSFRETLRLLESEQVYIVPLFFSEGYFSEEVLPREFRLTDREPLDVEKSVHITKPIGTHPSLADVIVHRAESAVGDALPDGQSPALVLIGHGTKRNPKSRKSIENHAARIRHKNVFEEVHSVFLEEEPMLDRTATISSSDNVAAVPLFISDGFHTEDEIPEDIGIIDDQRPSYERGTPRTVKGRQLWYTEAAGLDPLVASVILERAREEGAPVRNPVPFPEPGDVSRPASTG
jgi:sirohydrochlorin cobaltochelatase